MCDGSKPLNICLFTPNFLPALGGAERMADVIVRQLIARGHEVCVLAQKYPEKEPDLPYPVRRYRRPPAQHLWPELLSSPLRRAHRLWRFDLVLAFYAYPTGFAAARIKEQLGVRVIVNTRGGDLYPNYHGLSKPRVARTIQRGYRMADAIISLSRWTTNRLHEIVGDDLPPVDQIPNGIDLNQHDGRLNAARDHQPDCDPQSPFILHMARLSEVKQHETALQAVAQTADMFRSSGWKYLIAGEGNLADHLQKRIHQLGIDDIVRMLGSRTGIERDWLLAHAQFAVTASREEGMPNVVIESMASGLPMLASDIDPHRELLENANWGMLFSLGDHDALATALAQWMQADLSQQRTAAMQHRTNYSLEKMIDGYERACRRALQSSSG